jgi:hypothetical protein
MAKKSRKAKVEETGFTEEQQALLTSIKADVDKAYRVNRQPNVSAILGRAIAALKDLEATSQ